MKLDLALEMRFARGHVTTQYDIDSHRAQDPVFGVSIYIILIDHLLLGCS